MSGNAGETRTNVVTATLSDDDGITVEPNGDAKVTITDVLPTATVGATAAPTSRRCSWSAAS